MKRIIVNEDNFMLRVSNNFLMENTIMKPNEYLLYINIFRLIQKIESANIKNEIYIEKDEYSFTKTDLLGIFNDKTYKKCNLDKIIEGMIDNQIEDIILNCDYNGKNLIVEFDRYLFFKYFMTDKNYTSLDVKDFVGLKGIHTIKFMMLINRFSLNGWVKIKEEDIRLLLNKTECDIVETKTLTRDIKLIISRLSDKFTVNDFEIVKYSNYIQYEFKFKSFVYIY